MHEDDESQQSLLEGSAHPNKLATSRTLSTRTLLLLFVGLATLSILAAASFFTFGGTSSFLNGSSPRSNRAQITIQFAPPQIQHFWGAYTPYFPVKPYIPPPSHCHITQVHSIHSSSLLFLSSRLGQYRKYTIRYRYQNERLNPFYGQIQRHGARFPTRGATKRIVASLTKLQSATNYTNSQLSFLTNYTYSLGADDLVPLGASQFVTLNLFSALR